MRLIDYARNGLAAAWGRLQPLPPVSTADLREQLRSRRIRKILLIRPHQKIGDLILATPVFRALKEHYPDVELHFLGNSYNVVAVRDNPCLSKVWVWDKKITWNPRVGWRFLQTLRAEGFDLALILFSNAPSLNTFLVARLSGANWIGSCDTTGFFGKPNWSRCLANWQAPAAQADDPEYLKFFALVSPLTGGACPAPEFHIPERVFGWADNQWEKMGLNPGAAPIALFLGGHPDRPDRLWQPEQWARLARLLMDRAEGPLVAVCPPPGFRASGGVQEAGFYEVFRDALGEDLPIFDEPGLPEAAAFLKPMSLFICPDGGLFHAAAAAGVRTLGLFFSTDPALWRPPRESVTCLRAPQGRPDLLSPETVFQTVLRFRQRSSTPAV